MKNIIKIMKNYLFGFILGILLFGVVGVYAATKIYASGISIDTTNISELAGEATLDTAITTLYEKTNSTECPEGYNCIKKPQVGDYVKMTPILTSFTTDTAYTGYKSTQTINPSELNLWRVIKVNDDGTIDMVSEYTSSRYVYFAGKKGYINFVGYLNELASKYENSKYTVGSRHMGYNGQTEYLTDIANTVESTTAPWTSNTGSLTVESQGGGDTLYKRDTELVKNALGTLVANGAGTTKAGYYWLATRLYMYTAGASRTSWDYNVRYVISTGDISVAAHMYGCDDEGNFNTSGVDFGQGLRPIVTLKSGLKATGSGTKSDPWVLP